MLKTESGLLIMAEKEYIEREALIEEAKHNKAVCQAIADIVDVKDIINNTPVADVAPIRHGHWIYQSSRKFINTDVSEEKLQKEILGYGGRVVLNLQCSVCRKVTMVCNSISYEYCPHCGAKMDGDTNGS